jgi:signal peptidase I
MEAADTIGCDLASEVAAVFGSVRLRVSGTSMTPTLCPGELVSVERTRMTEIGPGEIIVFARNGRLIIHRVLAGIQSQGECYLVTRGDRARKSDAPVSSSELVGRVTPVKRGHSGILASSRLKLASRAVARLLCFSDRGTHFYLHLVSCWRVLFPGRAACRA